MKPVTRSLETPIDGQRFYQLTREEGKPDSELMSCAFSSEAPVERWFPGVGRCMEVLDHSADSVDISFLKNRAPFLLDHDTRQQLGCIASCSLDADRVLRGKVQFGTNSLANDRKGDILSGIRPHASIGYRIRSLQYDEDTGELITDGEDERTGLPIVRVKNWEVYEASSVAIPADPSVGVGRSAVTPPSTKNAQEQRMQDDKNKAAEGGGGTATATPPASGIQTGKEAEDFRREERERVTEILEIGNRLNCSDEATKAVNDGTTVRAFALVAMRKQGQFSPQSPTIPAGNENHRNTPGDLFARNQLVKPFLGPGRRWEQGIRVGGDFDISYDEFRAYAAGWRPPMSRVGSDISGSTISGYTGRPVPFPVPLLGTQPPRIADLLTPGETDGLTVPYYTEETLPDYADALAETDALVQSGLDLKENTAAVKDIGHFMKVHENILNDVPQVQSVINSRLPVFVLRKEDKELLNGTGLTTHVTGLLNATGVLTLAYAGFKNLFEAIASAANKVFTTSFFDVEWCVMHPNDCTRMKLTQDANGQYYIGGPGFLPYGNGVYGQWKADAQVWGIPVIATTAITAGTALVGNRMGAQIFRRQGLTIQMSNSDGSDFIYRRVTFRAYLRLALVTWRPVCYCMITGIPQV